MSVYQADSILVDGHQHQLWVILISCLLDLEESGAKCRKLECFLQELNHGIISVQFRLFVESLFDLFDPIFVFLLFDEIKGENLIKNLRRGQKKVF